MQALRQAAKDVTREAVEKIATESPWRSVRERAKAMLK
jgi:hypothetical protein